MQPVQKPLERTIVTLPAYDPGPVTVGVPTFTNETLSGAEIVVESLIRLGVRMIFGLPGGAALPLYDALFRRSDTLRHILARHEQGAAFMAQGYARLTGRAGVCISSSGPGVTNLVTGIADAFRDSIPLIAITAQVPLDLIGTDAFQEIDTRGMCLPITKHVFAVRSAQELLEIMPVAFDLAEGGRPGPVVIDIPKDVQQERLGFSQWPERQLQKPVAIPGPSEATESLDEPARELLRMIGQARRPAILAGGGIIHANAADLLCDFARRLQIPVTTTLMGLGLMPADDPLFLGMPGMHAAPWTNYVLDETDLLICIGARFDDRATGRPDQFCSGAKIAHIDIDAAEIGKIKAVDLSIVADAREALAALLAQLDQKNFGAGALDAEQTDRGEWLRHVSELRDRHPLRIPEGPRDFNRPLHLLQAIGEILGSDTIITTDVGQHQMWVAQVYPFRRPRTLITSGGLGTMGFGLPAAIGAALAAQAAGNPAKVVCISGDGSILMNIQELATLAELTCNLAVIILDNGHLGLVRQQQELFYASNFHGSRFESRTDFAGIARAFGVDGIDLSSAENQSVAEDWLRSALASERPCVIRVPTVAEDLVLPMVPAGAANRDMIL